VVIRRIVIYSQSGGANMRTSTKVLIVILLISLFLLLLLAGLDTGIHEASYVKATLAQLKVFKLPMGLYKKNVGVYPTKLDYLWVCPPGMEPSIWKGPYMEGEEIINFDSWGSPYQVELIDNDQCRITSAGPDRMFGSADDIWQDYFNH
jgi:general secretion pathway protein G